MAQNYSFTIDQGADWYLNVAYKDSAGTAINLTGYTAAMQFRITTTSAVAAISLTQASGITITGATGNLAIHATAAQTGALDDSAKYDYDLEITSPSGVVTRLIQGVASVSSQITR
jgi:hypothetical protein